ncbi:MAG: ribulokinase [Clostridia bacterium]|nr:ribulokinase [Clostridia bacterium]
MEERYVIGLDYGTLSGRAVLVRLRDGVTVAGSVLDYAHGVMDTWFTPSPDIRRKLPNDWALQHPRDYIEVLEKTIPDVLDQANIDPRQVAGIGIDFTASSPLPVLKEGTPLCFLPRFAADPHAYVKLWKHHGAAAYAERLQKTAEDRNEPWLDACGGKISGEWLIPKLYQVAAEAPDVYRTMDLFVEAGDWIVWQLTGRTVTSTCMAGYKCNYTEDGFPTPEYLAAVDPVLADARSKWVAEVLPVGAKAGCLTGEWAERLQLWEGCPVAVAGIDGHAAVPAAGIHKAGQMMLILGTSSCHMLIEDRFKRFSGICGRTWEGMIPGFWGYESGQCCVGDHYAWLADNLVPASYMKEAEERGMHIQTLLTEKAEKLAPGQSGLIALDWWNGNRSVLMDEQLSGLLVGMTLGTRVEEIYRALIEATAYGTRKIVENFRENGLRVEEILVTGGITGKNPMLMQIYADILQMELKVAGGTSALGAAIYGAVAADAYPTMTEAVAHMGIVTDVTYTPNKANAGVYDDLYAEYLRLHELFGRGEENGEGYNDVMKRLRKIRSGI